MQELERIIYLDIISGGVVTRIGAETVVKDPLEINIVSLDVPGGDASPRCVIEVFNMNEETRRRVLNREQQVTLYAGYADVNVARVFTGSITSFKTERVDTQAEDNSSVIDVKTTIWMKDQLYTFLQKTVYQATYTGEVKTANLILDAIYNRGQDQDSRYYNRRDIDIENLGVLDGDTYVHIKPRFDKTLELILNDLLAPHAVNWTCYLNKIILFRRTAPPSSLLSVTTRLNTGTGLLSLPVVTDNGVEVKMLFNSSMRPGNVIILDNLREFSRSKHLEDVPLRVVSVKSRGDNNKGEFVTMAECVAQNPETDLVDLDPNFDPENPFREPIEEAPEEMTNSDHEFVIEAKNQWSPSGLNLIFWFTPRERIPISFQGHEGESWLDRIIVHSDGMISMDIYDAEVGGVVGARRLQRPWEVLPTAMQITHENFTVDIEHGSINVRGPDEAVYSNGWRGQQCATGANANEYNDFITNARVIAATAGVGIDSVFTFRFIFPATVNDWRVWGERLFSYTGATLNVIPWRFEPRIRVPEHFLLSSQEEPLWLDRLMIWDDARVTMDVFEESTGGQRSETRHLLPYWERISEADGTPAAITATAFDRDGNPFSLEIQGPGDGTGEFTNLNPEDVDNNYMEWVGGAVDLFQTFIASYFITPVEARMRLRVTFHYPVGEGKDDPAIGGILGRLLADADLQDFDCPD